ncbi:MAG: response regulator [Planctomycetota bacterium]
MKILLIEDDPRVASFVQRGLDQLGFHVQVASDGARGFELVMNCTYDVVVLDLLLPHMDGGDVLCEMRRRGSTVPVLVLSAKDGVGDRVLVLNQGADDFLVKPFSFDELCARIHALARRPPVLDGPTLRIVDLQMDLRTRQVERGGRAIQLTHKEFALLEYLLRSRGTVVTRAMIAEHVWNQHFDSFSNVIEVYIRYLRTKVDDDFEVKLIHTVRGVGYVLSERHS